jgi:methylated-DNA-protein-cysteine methyltransferase-like protein
MSEFNDKVKEIVRCIPSGRVMTYGQIAALLGVPRAARAVGWALHATGDVDEVPCQRVVNRFGGLAAGYGWGGQQAHKVDLAEEGVEVREDFTIDLQKYQWWPQDSELSDLELSLYKQTELDQKLPEEHTHISRRTSLRHKTI